MKVRSGGSVRSLLCEQLGLDPEYVKNRIQTAFLNGKPVDDFDTAVVGEGAVLTLSGALPGLAGATLRKGGFFSAMRASLSYQGEAGAAPGKEKFITIRVFNILLPELAPILLARGIFLSREDLASVRPELPPEERPDFPRKGGEEPGALESETGKGEEAAEAEFLEVRSGG